MSYSSLIVSHHRLREELPKTNGDARNLLYNSALNIKLSQIAAIDYVAIEYPDNRYYVVKNSLNGRLGWCTHNGTEAVWVEDV